MRQRATIAAAYFNEAVDAWFQGWVSVQNEFTWEEFVTKLCERFGERNNVDPIEELINLGRMGVWRYTLGGLRTYGPL